MISQLLMDVGAFFLAFFIDTLPALPGEFDAAIGQIGSESAALALSIQRLSPLVPFEQIQFVLALFPIAMGWWLSLVVIKMTLLVVALVRFIR